jgi:hypothetical protein
MPTVYGLCRESETSPMAVVSRVPNDIVQAGHSSPVLVLEKVFVKVCRVTKQQEKLAQNLLLSLKEWLRNSS